MISFLLVAAVSGLYVLLIFLLDGLCRLNGFSGGISRKVIHVVTGLATLFTPYLLTGRQLLAVGFVIAVFMYCSGKRNILASIHDVSRKSWGAIFFPLGVGISGFLFFPDNIRAFQYGVLILSLSDAAASIVGENMKSHAISIMGNKKSAEGALAFFIATLFITGTFPMTSHTDFSLADLLITTGQITAIEFILFFGLDNLVLPILSPMVFMFMLG